jgi:hypothetical protein
MTKHLPRNRVLDALHAHSRVSRGSHRVGLGLGAIAIIAVMIWAFWNASSDEPLAETMASGPLLSFPVALAVYVAVRAIGWLVNALRADVGA